MEGKGGRILQRHLQSLDEAREFGDLVVNCSGLGARRLCDDQRVYGVQGDTLLVECPSVQTGKESTTDASQDYAPDRHMIGSCLF